MMSNIHSVTDNFKAVQQASKKLIQISGEKVRAVLISLAEAAISNAGIILMENQKDLDRMSTSDPKYDRLQLTNKRLQDIANEINFYHTDSVRDKIQDLIAFNYVGKNNMDSDFWKQIPSSARNRLKSSENFKIFANNIINNKIDTSYFTHDAPLMKQYVEGYNIDLKEFL